MTVTAPGVSAQEEYVGTGSVSPDRKEYSIGWTTDDGNDLPSSGFRSTPSRDYSFENINTEEGIQTLIHIENENAPTSYEFPIDLPEGAEITPFNDGGFAIFDGEELVATFEFRGHLIQTVIR
ncbi:MULTISPECIES: hypothetical protein [unclassified Corynebacterium]|uniref:hypothetical protein n=1 Tax=unclassified Corynebacterium TaxID=2624378 RepID=UPI001D0E39CF|nr:MULTISPECIES: hypothetical protein [unclassified Corynebacterium]